MTNKIMKNNNKYRRNGRAYCENDHQEKNYLINQFPQQDNSYVKRSSMVENSRAAKGMESSNRKDKEREVIDYFAGAKFDCLPCISTLPTPPEEWTIPVMRSQSQPASPVNSAVRIDVGSLFHTPQVLKSSSYAGKDNVDMETLFVKRFEEEKKAKLNGMSHLNKTAENKRRLVFS